MDDDDVVFKPKMQQERQWAARELNKKDITKDLSLYSAKRGKTRA